MLTLWCTALLKHSVLNMQATKFGILPVECNPTANAVLKIQAVLILFPPLNSVLAITASIIIDKSKLIQPS